MSRLNFSEIDIKMIQLKQKAIPKRAKSKSKNHLYIAVGFIRYGYPNNYTKIIANVYYQ